MRLVVFKLLEDVNSYAKAFDAASPYLQSRMHEYATEYYALGGEIKMFEVIDDAFLSIYFPYVTEVSLYCSGMIRAYVARNYTFLETEYDKIISIDQDEMVSFIWPIEIIMCLHRHYYERCLWMIRRCKTHALLLIVETVKEYEFVDTAWQYWHARNIEIDASDRCIVDIYMAFFRLFVNNALKNEKWSELYDFTIGVPSGIRKQFNVDELLCKFILSTADIVFDSITIKKDLKRLRRTALDLIVFSEDCLGRSVGKPYYFDDYFKSYSSKMTK